MRSPPNLRRRKRQRGAVVAETAYSLIILAFVMTAGIQFGDAMVVRHRLTNAANRAARVCSVGPNAANPNACAQQNAVRAVDTLAARCQPLRVNAGVEDLNGVRGLRVELQCAYVGSVWSGLYDRFVGQPLTLRAQAMMPIQ
jgi:Flp pilus assembly protein TadG